jgi:hypothetical protein
MWWLGLEMLLRMRIGRLLKVFHCLFGSSFFVILGLVAFRKLDLGLGFVMEHGTKRDRKPL